MRNSRRAKSGNSGLRKYYYASSCTIFGVQERVTSTHIVNVPCALVRRDQEIRELGAWPDLVVRGKVEATSTSKHVTREMQHALLCHARSALETAVL